MGGWRIYLAEQAKKVVKIPVIGGGMIRQPALAEQVIKKGQADFVLIGRPLLADPNWVSKVAQGKEQDIRPCIVCNQCISSKFKGMSLRCTVNYVEETRTTCLCPQEGKKRCHRQRSAGIQAV